MHPELAAIVKAYDVRGRVPEQLTVDIARALGAAFAHETKIAGNGGSTVVGRDMRISGPDIAGAIIEGIRSQGAHVIDIELASTDLLYCASGVLDMPGIMVTASHNPAHDNGLKLCRAGARPIGFNTGLSAIAERASAYLDADGFAHVPPASLTGNLERRDFLPDYVGLVNELAPVSERRAIKVVVDAGNGMAGLTVPAVFAMLPNIELIPLYLELDGTFPNHDANPLDYSTLVDAQAAIKSSGADLGLAFDGDADRCFVIDETGEVVAPSAIAALIATRALAVEPGATILHNVICSRAVPEIIAEHGGVAVRTPVGHSLIKAEMARTGAVFGGEHSGHFYFREFFLADSGMVAALHVLAALAETDGTVSELMAAFTRYAASGEINSTVGDQAAVIENVASAYRDAEQDRLDGLTVTSQDWWFNVRASNTEPLLRLNVEGVDRPTMERVRDEVLSLIAGPNLFVTTQ